MSEKASASRAPESDGAPSRIGQVVASRYRLEALLGVGATGAVYRAAHPGGHPVAVKILDQSLMQSEVAQRFVRESQLMLSIHHPHVVRTLAAGRDETLRILYLVMPLLRGDDLDTLLQRHGAIDPSAAVRVALQAARGIAAAHRLGVVHRDIKPANLFIDAGSDGRLCVRVCDFGIAKGSFGGNDVGITRTGTQLGTPDYISPEQLKDSKTVDARADVWGLGATLYEMLCGQPPFAHHGRVFDVIAAILGEDVPWLQDRAPWVDAELAHVVHRMLRRNPAERYASMDQLVEALLPFSSGDAGLTAAQLTAVSPILRKIQKPRGTPPPPQQKTRSAARSTASPASARASGDSAEAAQSHSRRKSARPPAPEASSPAQPAAAGPKKRVSAEGASPAPAKPQKRRRGGRVFFTFLLLALALTAALFWFRVLEWQPLLQWVTARVPALALR